MCGVGSEGVNITNYVPLSGIYRIRDVPDVFGEIIVNPPGLLILDIN